jgi:hypothetical protein
MLCPCLVVYKVESTAAMKMPIILISIALLIISGGPACCQENGMIPKLKKIATVPFAAPSPEQEAEIRKLVEDFVIPEKENQTSVT